jgi:acyl-ACP thioesterase
MLEQRHEEIRRKTEQRKANYEFYHSKVEFLFLVSTFDHNNKSYVRIICDYLMQDENLEKQRMEELEKKKEQADTQRKAAAGEKISKLIDILS